MSPSRSREKRLHTEPSFALLAAVILACVAGAVSAVGAITTAEQFPGEGRIAVWPWGQPRPPLSSAALPPMLPRSWQNEPAGPAIWRGGRCAQAPEAAAPAISARSLQQGVEEEGSTQCNPA